MQFGREEPARGAAYHVGNEDGPADQELLVHRLQLSARGGKCRVGREMLMEANDAARLRLAAVDRTNRLLQPMDEETPAQRQKQVEGREEKVVESLRPVGFLPLPLLKSRGEGEGEDD